MAELPGEVDVVTWGAGIAGARAASVLAEAGRRVLVFPRGPASYPELPGFAIEGESTDSRRNVERELLERARTLGASIADGEQIISLQPESGPVRSVLTATANISTRVVIFADGSDPRIGRSRGLIPEWEPWHLIHFAYQRFEPQRVITSRHVAAGERNGCEWRGFSIPLPDSHMIGAAWFLEHEMATNIHVQELLPDVGSQFGVRGDPLDGLAVEVAPIGSGRIHARLYGENILAVGDMTGLVNPFSLRRVEVSRKMGELAGSHIDAKLAGAGDVVFNDEARKLLQSSVADIRWPEAGLAMPSIPGPERVNGDRSGLAGLLRRMINRSGA